MTRIVPLAEWYPAMYRRWLDSDRRYLWPLDRREGYSC